ncbi:MAG: glycosyltransferase [Pseudomonadota bacterium]
MKILFIHQNFIAQYKHILERLVRAKEHQIVFLTQKTGLPKPVGYSVIEYTPDHIPRKDAYPYSAEFEKACANGAKVAEICHRLSQQGFRPDIIIGHTGWGEMLFLKEVWPDIPVLSYFEYFYTAKGGAVGFDPEFPISDVMPYIMNARNAINHLSYEACDLGQTATQWQKNGYPDSFHDKINVMHEGIRTDICVPNDKAKAYLGRLDVPVTRDDEIFTYMARNMEPVRGFHIFMRALPKILDARPNARVLIIGGNQVSYGRRPPPGQSYRGLLEQEVGARIDWSRVHFLGQVPYQVFLAVMQLSRCHIYLTVPFVPSWSVMEAMSIGAPVLASDVAPVRELIEPEKTGLLTDFFDPDALADRAIELLKNRKLQKKLGAAARRHICAKYDFNDKIAPQNMAMINALLPKRVQLAA